MRRPIARLLIAAAALAAVPAVAEARGPFPHGRHGGKAVVTVVTRPHAVRPFHYRPVVRQHYRPVVRRHYRPYRPVIVIPRRPILYAPPPVIYARPAVAAAPAVQAAANPERYCREYVRTVTIGGRPAEAYGTACLEPDGAWVIVD